MNLSAANNDREELLASVRLALVSGVGPRLRKALLERFGSALAVFQAAPSDLRAVPGIGPQLTGKIVAAREEIDVEAELRLCEEHDIELLAEEDAGYPRLLREIHDPPGILFVAGKIMPQDDLSVAIVGSRHATQYGLRQAERLAESLARAGLTIVSGLARGIDAAAHRGALNAGGRTLAVLGSGLLNIYPPDNERLAAEIRTRGALMSEMPPRSPPLGGAFPQRNRIITGLSLGVIVVEASLQSGALISARHAMEQGREVFAVPGCIDSRMSRGCHRLIRDGAKLIETADDVLEEFGPLVAPAMGTEGQTIHHPAELLLNELEQKVLSAVGTEPTLVDHVIVTSGLPGSQVLSTLTVLEMRRLVRRTSGASFIRV